MKKLALYSLLVALAVGCTADLEDQLVKEGASSMNHSKIIHSSEDATPGKLLVYFNSESESRLAKSVTRSGATRSGIEGVDAILDKIGGYAVEQLFMVTEKNREKVYAAGLHRWYVLYFDEESDLDNAAAELANVAEVQRVEFSLKVQRVTPKKVAVTNISAATRTSQAQVSNIPFNDPYRFYQWGLDNQGVNSQVTDSNMLFEPIVEADINAVPAWKLCTGDPSIVVAIVDEGVMYTHEDLKDNYCYNKAELNGTAGKDDDGNGFIDDIYGWNFVKKSAKLTWDKDNLSDRKYSDSGHGVHVAGIVSAVNNNGIGISSIAGGSGKKDGVKLFSAQIFSANGKKGNGGDVESSSRAIQYAADRGAHILQCSWGYKGGAIKSDVDFESSGGAAEADAIRYFIANGGTPDGPIDGGVAIFAAGNESTNMPGYPGAFEPCVSVASIGPSLKPALYTNFSYGVDIAAPGGDQILYRGSSLEYYNVHDGGILSSVPSKFDGNDSPNYAMFQGTSMACPMVSGVAALGLSYAKKLGKRYTANEFRSILLSATNDINPFLTYGVTLSYGDGTTSVINFEDYKGKMGTGYIDAYKLLLQIDGTPYTTVVAGEMAEIDLTPYFGTGIKDMTYKGVTVSAEDISTVGWSNASYSNGKLQVTCSKSGVATVNVTMYVGGVSGSDQTPSATEITKTFVIMSRAKVAENGGWL